jgi:hypothetical protein
MLCVQLERQRAQVLPRLRRSPPDPDVTETEPACRLQAVEAVDEQQLSLLLDHGQRRPRLRVLHQGGDVLLVDAVQPGLQALIDRKLEPVDRKRFTRVVPHRTASSGPGPRVGRGSRLDRRG